MPYNPNKLTITNTMISAYLSVIREKALKMRKETDNCECMAAQKPQSFMIKKQQISVFVAVAIP